MMSVDSPIDGESMRARWSESLDLRKISSEKHAVGFGLSLVTALVASKRISEKEAVRLLVMISRLIDLAQPPASTSPSGWDLGSYQSRRPSGGASSG